MWTELKSSYLALLFPLILIVGIRFGLFTPSEAGAFAVVYAFVIGKFVYTELTWATLRDVLNQTVVSHDEAPGSNAFLTRDQVGRALYNCVILGRRIEVTNPE